jgi:hypothetical protein
MIDATPLRLCRLVIITMQRFAVSKLVTVEASDRRKFPRPELASRNVFDQNYL